MSRNRFQHDEKARARYFARTGGKDEMTGDPLRDDWHIGHKVSVNEGEINEYPPQFIDSSANLMPINRSTNEQIGSKPHYEFYPPGHPLRDEAKAEYDALIEICEAAKEIYDEWCVFEWPDLSQYPELLTPQRNEWLGLPPRNHPVLSNVMKRTVGAKYESQLDEICLSLAMGHYPYPYQAATVHHLIDRWSKSKTDLGEIIVAPTGSGKTAMGILTIHSILKVNPNALIYVLVPSTDLFEQWQKRFDAAGFEDYSILGAGHDFVSKTNGLTLAMAQTVQSSFKQNSMRIRSTPHFCLIDECHQKHYQYFMKAWLSRGTKVVGLTATPHNWELRRYFNPSLIIGARIDDLRAKGLILDCDFFVPETARVMYERMDAETMTADEKEISEFIYCTEVTKVVPDAIREFENAFQKKFVGVVVSTSKSHARDIAATLCRAFGSAYAKVFLSEEGNEAELDDILCGRVSTKTAVVLRRFLEGYDNPMMENIIIARRNLKKFKFVQIRGRVVRPWTLDKEKKPRLIDLGFNVDRFEKIADEDEKGRFDDVYDVIDYQASFLPPIPAPAEIEGTGGEKKTAGKPFVNIEMNGKLKAVYRAPKPYQTEMFILDEGEKMYQCIALTNWQLTKQTLNLYEKKYKQRFSSIDDYAIRLNSYLGKLTLDDRSRAKMESIVSKTIAKPKKENPVDSLIASPSTEITMRPDTNVLH